jgi:hypothetical protein
VIPEDYYREPLDSRWRRSARRRARRVIVVLTVTAGVLVGGGWAMVACAVSAIPGG